MLIGSVIPSSVDAYENSHYLLPVQSYIENPISQLASEGQNGASWSCFMTRRGMETLLGGARVRAAKISLEEIDELIYCFESMFVQMKVVSEVGRVLG